MKRPMLPRLLLWGFVILSASHEVAFMLNPYGAAPAALRATSPPFGPSTLFLGSRPEQRSIRVELELADGAIEHVDLNDYFGYELWHRPGVVVPERSQALLRSEPTEPHHALVDRIARKYRERHPERELAGARVYLHRWNLPEEPTHERVLVIERRWDE